MPRKKSAEETATPSGIVRTTFSLSSELDEEVEYLCYAHRMSKADFLRNAVRKEVERMRGLPVENPRPPRR